MMALEVSKEVRSMINGIEIRGVAGRMQNGTIVMTGVTIETTNTVMIGGILGVITKMTNKEMIDGMVEGMTEEMTEEIKRMIGEVTVGEQIGEMIEETIAEMIGEMTEETIREMIEGMIEGRIDESWIMLPYKKWINAGQRCLPEASTSLQQYHSR